MQIASTRSYMIDRTETESDYEPITILGPVGNKGQHGSGVGTSFSGSAEPHVLAIFLSNDEINSELIEYLNSEHRCVEPEV